MANACQRTNKSRILVAKNIRFGRAGSCPAIKKSKSFNVVVRHSRDMDIVDADKLLIYEICHHYLAFDTDGNFFS
jgi:urease accessory protein UreE